MTDEEIKQWNRYRYGFIIKQESPGRLYMIFFKPHFRGFFYLCFNIVFIMLKTVENL